MLALIVSGLVAAVLWAPIARKARRWGVPAPIVMIGVGAIVAVIVGNERIDHELNTDLAERIVEIVLAVLLFTDATEVRGGFFAGERGVVARLLAIALPLSLAAALAASLVLLPGMPFAVMLVLACVVMPLDFAPAADTLRDKRLSRRVRHTLAVESGYNDGIISPVFAFALLLAESGAHADGLAEALEGAVPAAVVAIVVGVGIGAIAGGLMRVAERARWADAAAVRVALVALPIVVYFVAIPFHGNGFVAAFLAGIAYRTVRLRGAASAEASRLHHELSTLDGLGWLVSMLVWTVVGAVVVLVVEAGLDAGLILYGVIALTLARLVPVVVSLLGSRLSWPERLVIGALGPRGVSSMVFGLLAFNALREDWANDALYVTVVVALGSVLLHGLLPPLVLRRRARGPRAGR